MMCILVERKKGLLDVDMMLEHDISNPLTNTNFHLQGLREGPS